LAQPLDVGVLLVSLRVLMFGRELDPHQPPREPRTWSSEADPEEVAA